MFWLTHKLKLHSRRKANLKLKQPLGDQSTKIYVSQLERSDYVMCLIIRVGFLRQYWRRLTIGRCQTNLCPPRVPRTLPCFANNASLRIILLRFFYFFGYTIDSQTSQRSHVPRLLPCFFVIFATNTLPMWVFKLFLDNKWFLHWLHYWLSRQPVPACPPQLLLICVIFLQAG